MVKVKGERSHRHLLLETSGKQHNARQEEEYDDAITWMLVGNASR